MSSDWACKSWRLPQSSRACAEAFLVDVDEDRVRVLVLRWGLDRVRL